MPSTISSADNVFFSIFKRSSLDTATGMPGAAVSEQESVPGQFVDFALSLDKLAANPENRSDTYRLHVARQNLSVDEARLSGRKVTITHQRGMSNLFSELSSADQKSMSFEIVKAIPVTREKLVITLQKGVGVA